MAEPVQEGPGRGPRHVPCWATVNPPRSGGVHEQTTRERWHKVHALLDSIVVLLDCSRRLNLALNTVKRYARIPEPSADRVTPRYRTTLLDPYREHLRQRRAEDPGVPVTQPPAREGCVSSGVVTTNLAGRPLRDLVRLDSGQASHADLPAVPWVNHKVCRWVSEPFQWMEIQSIYAICRTADQRERLHPSTARPAWRSSRTGWQDATVTSSGPPERRRASWSSWPCGHTWQQRRQVVLAGGSSVVPKQPGYSTRRGTERRPAEPAGQVWTSSPSRQPTARAGPPQVPRTAPDSPAGHRSVRA